MSQVEKNEKADASRHVKDVFGDKVTNRYFDLAQQPEIIQNIQYYQARYKV